MAGATIMNQSQSISPEFSAETSPEVSMQKRPKLAIILPCYNEEAIIEQSWKVITQKLQELVFKKKIAAESFLCFVDDGSSDNTLSFLMRLKTKAPQHKIVKLAKNYGHQSALLAGLYFVKNQCDCAVTMDCDLQDDINAIDEMLARFDEGCEVVCGVRKARKTDTTFKKSTALAFYKLMHAMNVKILYNHADYRLLSERAIAALLEFSEVNLFLRGIVPLLGFKNAVVYYERLARSAGRSKYPFSKMLAFALNGITSFSVVPLRLLTFFGVLLFFFCFCYGAYALYVKLFTNDALSGWTSTVLIVLFLGGTQFLGLGIMGEYIGKIYAEVKRCPRYFIDQVF